MFYNLSKTLSKDCLINILMGGRGIGKTFSFTEYCVNKFLKTGHMFLYIRRYKEEMADIKKFFDDVKKNSKLLNDRYGNIDYRVVGGKRGAEFYINGKICGYAIVLSIANFKKGMSFEGVRTILFDEFTLEKGFVRYLPDEVHDILNLYETIARPGTRDYDVRLLLFGNNVSPINPYTTAFDLNMPKGKKFLIQDDVLYEHLEDAEVQEAKRNSRFYKAVARTGFGDYAVENKALYNDDDTLVEKKSGKCEFQFTILYKGKKYGVWKNYDNMTYYVSYDIDNRHIRTYAFTLADHSENTRLIKTAKKDISYRRFIDSYQYGSARFENKNIKAEMNDLFRKVMF